MSQLQLTLTEDHFVHNVLYILKWDAQRNLQLLRKPVDKERWATEPAVVNAFYSPNKNDIVFPAGILQPLFYSSNFPKSLNYGGIGVVIGHEITHGFDDKGRQFDKDGNMIQWWNNATIRWDRGFPLDHSWSFNNALLFSERSGNVHSAS